MPECYKIVVHTEAAAYIDVSIESLARRAMLVSSEQLGRASEGGDIGVVCGEQRLNGNVRQKDNWHVTCNISDM